MSCPQCFLLQQKVDTLQARIDAAMAVPERPPYVHPGVEPRWEELARVVNAGPVADGWALGRRHVLAVLAEKEKE